MTTRGGTFRKYLDDHPDSAVLLEHLRQTIVALGPVEEKESKSQLAFRRRRTVAAAWAPGQYLGERGAPLALTVTFAKRDPSPRWKEIVEPKPGLYTHHLEL
ncbi:MAG TPA: hypothetical protein VLJ88_06180, partial [Propionibacteriaceae bacterium]|nr:hypothetical protein [Propionibacteriaceae bacterium]